ncbi:MAG: 16S rRNA (cytosine(967)-C(5))-methyltransferase RsmB [Bacillota bacterium]|nr:16S rRNA (cytosine(967)-C(5))-methyltransferase RsmB [Bacillota bacterium]
MPAVERRYGRPAPEQGKAPVPAVERRYGRPAPEQGKAPAPVGERRYGRPAPEQGKAPAFTGERRYGRPASAPAPAAGSYSLKSKDKERPEPILSQDARQAALLVLNRVLSDGAYASLSLDEVFSNMRLIQKDKRLAAVIVYKTVEDLLKLDYALGKFLQDAEALNGKIRNILRLSACQILLMDKIPDFAAVNEAVELTRANGFEEMTGLVNGVLRSLIRSKDDLAWPEPDSPDYVSVTYSIPQWLADTIMSGYPKDVAEQIIAYRNPDHVTTIRRNRVLTSKEEIRALLDKKVWEVKDGQLEDVFYVKGASDIAKDTDFLAGRFSIQGEGSMLSVLALSPEVGMTVLDCCAAPGGKTCYMAELMQNTGRVHAWDVHEHRVDLIYAQAERLRLYNIRPAVRDSSVYLKRFDQTMDAVLLDAPCSGTGVMDNKPDIKYRLTAEGLAELVTLQAQLLETNARYVKSGGILVYSTCSILPQENEEQIKAFLSAHPEFVLDELPASFPERFAQHQGDHGIQLLPHRDGVEGFFIARLKRK